MERESKNKIPHAVSGQRAHLQWGHFSTPMRLPLMSAALSVSPIELQLHLFKRSIKEKMKVFLFLVPPQFAIPAACQPLWSFLELSADLVCCLQKWCMMVPSVPGVDRGGNWSAAVFRPQLTGMVSKTLWQLQSLQCHIVSDVNEEVKVKVTYAELLASFFFFLQLHTVFTILRKSSFSFSSLSFAFCLHETLSFKTNSSVEFMQNVQLNLAFSKTSLNLPRRLWMK